MHNSHPKNRDRTQRMKKGTNEHEPLGLLMNFLAGGAMVLASCQDDRRKLTERNKEEEKN